MRALIWRGKEDVRCDTGNRPEIEHPRYAARGDILDHESMREVVDRKAQRAVSREISQQ
ncbi:UNVERIFIED_ORG: hypothetical protein GGI57_005347 [Rhizobium aethiopicum]